MRRYDAWHRHVTLALLAHAYLESHAPERARAPSGGRAARGGASTNRTELIALTVPEVRRLLLLVAAPEDAVRDHHLRWSLWRRRHQAVARRGHRARRAQRPPPSQPGPATPGPIPVLAVPGTAALSETAWVQIAALVSTAGPRRGHPSGDLRWQLEGMLAVMHSGGPWREVPPAYGPWQTIYARYALWVRTGLWEQIAAVLHPGLPAPESAAPP